MKKVAAFLAGAMLMMATSAWALSSGAKDGEYWGYMQAVNGDRFYDTGAEAVSLTDTDGFQDSMTAFLMLELAGFSGSNKFGIYGFTQNGTNVTLGEKLEIFNGADSAPTFDAPYPSSKKLLFDLKAGTVSMVGTSLTAHIGKTFGFYIDSTVGSGRPDSVFYTHKSLNADGQDHFKVYDTSKSASQDLMTSDVVLGIEDLYGGGDQDFNDMVVGVTDVTPVPEPGTMVLLGFGMLGLAIYGKRRMNKEA